MSSKVIPSSERLPLERSARARSDDGSLATPEPLSSFSDTHAWVLIADPGAGKTDVFKALSAAEGGCCVSARNFVDLGLPKAWHEPIFIDGLDEVSAGSTAGSTALGQIRTKLQTLEVPKFRISCREADWRGNSDGNALQYLVGKDSFLELHLAPLDRSQTQALIAHWKPCNDADATTFIREAESRSLDGLLDNPQTLRMLVKARANGWPDSKTETYELACDQLARESNVEHLAANRHSLMPADRLRQAAGFLSTVMLLSGSTEIALQRQDDPPTAVALSELVSGASAPDVASCQAVLETRLFKGDGRGSFWPVHRTVAEYLGARYLVSRIHDGLPFSRVLALMLGEDGGVVPELRGLHAWLAATAPQDLRRELIDHDPLGVVLNGGVRDFSHAEKLHVLDALRNEADRYTYFRNQNWASHPFGALATEDMTEDFRELLQSTNRNPSHLALMDCVLDALAHGHAMPSLAPDLERLVRNKTCWSGLRKEALHILVRYAFKDNSWARLMQLLDDIHGDVVEDLEDELLGTLLLALYPAHIPVAEVWRFFRQPKSEQLVGSYLRFWHDLPKTTAPTDIPALLDALLSTGYVLSDGRDPLGSPDIVGELLVAGVTQHGAHIEVERLYRWLSLGLSSDHYSPLSRQYQAALGQWIGQQPERYKALFVYALQKLDDQGNSSPRKLWPVRVRLYHAPEPDDVAPWYLSLALTCSNNDLRHELVQESSQLTERRQGSDAAIQVLENWAADHVSDASWVEEELRCPYPPPEMEQEHIEHEVRYKQRGAEESRQKINFFRETLPTFDTGPAHLGALVAVGDAYLNFYSHLNEETPEARLLDLLNNDAAWVRLAFKGLRQCLLRADMPMAEGIIDLNVKGQRYNLATPCLAAIDLRYTENPASAFDLLPAILESVVAFRLTNNFESTSAWFKQLIAQRPAILATVMQRLITAQIAAKKEHVDGLHALAHDADYAEVAKQITPALIAAFPVKASKKQLQSLRLLINTVLGRLDKTTQLRLIASKLACEGMDVAQRVYWLTAALQIAPEVYLKPAKQYVEKTQARVSHMFALLHELQDRGISFNLPASAQTFLIGLLGPRSSPSWTRPTGRAYWVTSEMELSRYVESLISALASNPDDAALQALTALQQRPDMKHWEDSLNRALYDQRITRRKALFKPASVTQVCNTLANLKPANARDLWALTLDHLTQLARSIRDGNTNDYDQYWGHENPKDENRCRNALLSDLKLRLPVGVMAVAEAQHADDKRADIEVMAAPHHVPIEIKVESHRNLWKAIPEQLVAKYGRDPASDGYAIYVVFWFTGAFDSTPIDGGPKPKTPLELQQRLSATVPKALRHKIAVLVVDCSRKK
jgi:hypothetical protein